MTNSRRSTRVLAWGAAVAVTAAGLDWQGRGAPSQQRRQLRRRVAQRRTDRRAQKNLELTWAPVAGATSYDVEFLDDDNPDMASTYPSTAPPIRATVNRCPSHACRSASTAGGCGRTPGPARYWSATGQPDAWLEERRSPAWPHPGRNLVPTLSWSPLPDASFYEVEFSLAQFDSPQYDPEELRLLDAVTTFTPYGVIVGNGLGYAAPGNM